ncbi:hypothetical protein [Bordetella sp. FB-8]|uniref:GumC family protein n=1 Tax=Bordetella sp. FB-8 TaxID=1159870 RepID=UPI000367C84A|nr:hypothetical protein [Bordetella sp. FB-8]
MFLFIAALGIIVALLRPPPYQAQATLLVLFAGYYDQSNEVKGIPVAPGVGQLNSVESQILNSPELHREVVHAELGPNASTKEFDKKLQDFESHFHLEQSDVSNTIKLSYYDADPQRAARVLSLLLKNYFSQRAAIFTSGRAAMLAEQRDAVRAKLDKANADLLAFQKAHGIVNITDQINRAVALENLLLQRKLENDAALVQDRSSLQTMLVASQDVQPTIMLFTDNTQAVQALATMQISLMQLETRRSDMASRYMDGSPFVQQLDKQIAAVRLNIEKQKRQLANATRYGHNSYYDTVRDRLTSLRINISGEIARQKELQAQLAQAHAQSQNLIAISDRLRQMQADRDLLADSYRTRYQLVEQADIQQEQASNANSTNVRVIQAPLPPTQRSLTLGLLMVASIVAALVVSILAVLVMASLRETFLSPEQIERALLLPVLSAPIIVRRAIGYFAARRGAAPAKPESAPPRRSRSGLNSRIAHSVYGRMASVIRGSSDATSKVVMLLASGKSEGVHRVIQGLAVELERRSALPIVILDMEASVDASAYGQINDQGLIDWQDVELGGDALFASRSEAVPDIDFHRVARHNIVVARPKLEVQGPSWQHAATLFGALRKDHEYILVHGPSANQSFNGIENSAVVDAVVLVVRAEVTRKPMIQNLKSQVLDSGGKLIGVAMTYRHVYIPGFLYRLFLNR